MMKLVRSLVRTPEISSFKKNGLINDRTGVLTGVIVWFLFTYQRRGETRYNKLENIVRKYDEVGQIPGEDTRDIGRGDSRDIKFQDRGLN